MRTIKFRAWNKRDERMEDDYCSSQIFTAYGFWSEELFVYEQFTGLKDKNGVDIYEGDVIKLSFENGIEIVDETPVIFKNGAWRIGGDLIIDYYIHDVKPVFEVINNIHQKTN